MIHFRKLSTQQQLVTSHVSQRPVQHSLWCSQMCIRHIRFYGVGLTSVMWSFLPLIFDVQIHKVPVHIRLIRGAMFLNSVFYVLLEIFVQRVELRQLDVRKNAC